jgi:hypothetical protein
VTYGYWLDQAATALDECRANLQGGLRGGYARAPAVIGARSGVYRALAHLAFLLTGPTDHAPTADFADYLINRRHRLVGTDPAVILRTGLQAAAHTDARLPPTAIPEDALIHHLNRARDALTTAGDVLASHLGRRVSGPRTPQGQAIAQGTGRDNAIADIATLSTTAIAIDRALLRWLNNRAAPQTLRPLYEDTTATMTWWTTSNYPATLSQLARTSRKDSLIRLLDTAPATETSTGPRHVHSLADVSAILDTTRAWMTQHPRETSLRHIRATTRLAYTIATTANRLHIADTTRYRASRWLAAANSLNGPADLLGPIHPTISQDLDKATAWLRDHHTPHQSPRTPTAVRDAELLNLTLKLPALAAQLHTATRSLVLRGQLLVSRSELEASPRSGLFHAKTMWRRARPNEPATYIILNCLRAASLGKTLPANLMQTPFPDTTPPAASHNPDLAGTSTAQPATVDAASNAARQQHPDIPPTITKDHPDKQPHDPWQKLSDDIDALAHRINTNHQTSTSAARRPPPRPPTPTPATDTPELAREEPDLA